jgi:glycosyltransferase involved in cell wall biosynthesis
MSSAPLVSVLVAVYNQKNVIEQTLNSITSQTHQNIEIIISDDCSTDNSQEILRRISATNSKIKLFLQDKNLGITQNYNFLVSKATAKYIAIFAGDDVMLPEKIEVQVNLLEKTPDASFCHHAVEVIDYESQKSQGVISHVYESGVTTIHDVLRNLGIPGSMSIMYRSEVLKVPVFSPEIPTASDWLHMIHLTMAGRGLYIDKVLCLYRKDSSYNGKDPSRYEDDFIKTIDITRKTYASPNNLIDKSCDYALARYSLGAGYRRLLRGDRLKSRRFFKDAFLERKLIVVAFILCIFTFIPASARLLTFAKRIYKKNT